MNVRSQVEGTLHQADEEYAAYRARASFFNATARRADGYLGLLFRRPPFSKVPEGANALGKAMRAFIDDADMLGTSLANYGRNVLTMPVLHEAVRSIGEKEFGGAPGAHVS